jgi:hypothetical protein
MKQKIKSCLLGMGLLAAVGLAYGADRFSYSRDGSEVTDNTTGLIWRRCAEGMTWSGVACTDSASTYSHQAALQLAQTQTGWRLPNVKELSSVVDRSFTNPAIDPTAFPNTPSGLFWTSSPYVGGSDNAWFVNFVNGAGKYNSREYGNYVRLVR